MGTGVGSPRRRRSRRRCEGVERRGRPLQRPAGALGERRAVAGPAACSVKNAVRRSGLTRPTGRVGASAVADQDGEVVMLEHMVDRLELILAQSQQHQVGLAGRIEQQLGDDFVGTAEVDQADLGEIEQGGVAPPRRSRARC